MVKDNGSAYYVPKSSFTSKINVDGEAFDPGAAFQFSKNYSLIEITCSFFLPAERCVIYY